MLKIIQSRLQQYVNYELSDVQDKGTRNQIANNMMPTLDHSESKQIPESVYFKAFMWITTNYGKFLEMGIPDHLT